uniref:non-specific serine/threonine protein kinase n=1 Tax=Vitis vinifera TaxID=29760 RepID=A5C118_VITVI|nr:hypothetical protein VITISV_029764 [Vitis vinifera]
MLLLLLLLVSPLLALSINQEGLFLQRVKQGFDDPTGALSNWNDRDDTPCNWYGVTCDPETRTVNSLDLSNTYIAGPFPTLLCRLHDLHSLSLYNNSINSTLPADISTTFSQVPCHPLWPTCPISGTWILPGITFPAIFRRVSAGCRRLEVLSLVGNLMDGTLPPFLGNISTLKQLNLSYNPFAPSRIPPELGNLTSLEILWLTQCNLVGPIPDSLGRLKRLTDLDLALNYLHGPIPTLQQLVVRRVTSRNAEPDDIATVRRLCQLPLESLNLYENRFEGKLPESIADSPNLYELRLFQNRLSGVLPKDLGKKSPLLWLDISYNQFSGAIPASLCSKGVLEELLLIHNSFSGEIPASLSECSSLTRVRLGNNQLSGEVPAGFWGLPRVYLLELAHNLFSGQIAKTIASASSLQLLIIWKNSFSGTIPDEVGGLENLVDFSGSDNQFSGPLPASIVNLRQLGKLDLHNNKLSGELPSGIHTWKKLNMLNLRNNGFSGNIPKEIGTLSILNYLDLSENRFSGKIPDGLQNLKLNEFNFSNNRLSGDIPSLYANKIYRDNFLGNPGLCGDLDGLCNGRGEAKSWDYVWVLRCIFILAAAVLIVGVGWFYWKYRSFKKAKRAIDKSKWTLMSFHKLGFSEYEILDCLDEDNVIGSGGSGKVYKAVLSNGEAVAVKKLWGGSNKGNESDDVEKGQIQDGFEAEVDTLGKIRHKNIVKLWCCCTTKDCKLLVYEYMPNGSLGDLLHSNKGGLLDWPTRYKIALDAAEGLSYLHHDCVPPIVHRDVKSNNILLDGDFGARVADFGVAKVVDTTGKGPKSMSVIAGSCGYIAPEYAYTLRVNEKSDLYSFGVVILELVTGRHPVDAEFGEDLVKWVCTTLDQKGVDHVLDPKLDSCFKEEICKVLNIGILCTSPLPINRPSMRRVVKMLQDVGGENQPKPVKKDGKLSPYYHEDASDQGSVV